MLLLERQAERGFHPQQMGSCALQNPKYMSTGRKEIGNQSSPATEEQ